MEHLHYPEIFSHYPPATADDLREEISYILETSGIKIVVLDDDPTGIQTVHGCLLLTNFEHDNLSYAFQDAAPLFYILTNSRSLGTEDARRVNTDAVNAVIRMNEKYRFRLIFVSRSDSTLRGHFPLEPDTIKATILQNHLHSFSPVFFAPAFLEAGRFTIGNIQYMKEGDELIPVGETEFARDSLFGYGNSELTAYISEKSGEKSDQNQIGSLSLSELRSGDIPGIMETVRSLSAKEYVIVNALEYHDLRKFSLAFLKVFAATGNCAVLRTSSSLPKALSGLEDKDFLAGNDFPDQQGAGLLIIGSHVMKTTLQLQQLLKNQATTGIEADITLIAEDPSTHLSTILSQISGAVNRGKTPVVYTSRNEKSVHNPSERLALGVKVSGFLVSIVRNLPFSPAFMVVKGGITSHDILVKGLGIQTARVLGQIIPGVPVILINEETGSGGMPYVIFPGNVGDENALGVVFEKLNHTLVK